MGFDLKKLNPFKPHYIPVISRDNFFGDCLPGEGKTDIFDRLYYIVLNHAEDVGRYPTNFKVRYSGPDCVLMTLLPSVEGKNNSWAIGVRSFGYKRRKNMKMHVREFLEGEIGPGKTMIGNSYRPAETI